MMTKEISVLTGKSVQLELLQESHYDVLKQLSRDEKVSTYSPALKLKFDSWFNKALHSDNSLISFVVRTLSDNNVVGATRFYDISFELKRLAIGYTWYIPRIWGSGVNTECKLLLLRCAFEKMAMNRIEFFIDARNARSCAAVKKLGAVEEGILRQQVMLDDGYVRDMVVCNLLRNEWES